MHKRTKACAISQKTKQVVWARDGGRCIFCGSTNALPEAHIFPRSHGGLGIPENIVTVCRSCHDKMDNSSARTGMLAYAKEYIRQMYGEWNEEKVAYRKSQNIAQEGRVNKRPIKYSKSR